MKIERKTVTSVPVGELAVDVETVTYRQRADSPILAEELTFRLTGATVASSYTFSPDGDQWRDPLGAEVTIDYMSARGLGKFQRHVVEAVGRTWHLHETLNDDPRTARERAAKVWELDGARRRAQAEAEDEAEKAKAKAAQDELYGKPATDADLAQEAV